jgi:hypothetical protein
VAVSPVLLSPPRPGRSDFSDIGRVALAVLGTSCGARHTASLYRLLAGGVLEEDEVESPAGGRRQCGLLQEEPRDTERTLQSAGEVGMAQPEGIPIPLGQRRLLPGADLGSSTPKRPRSSGSSDTLIVTPSLRLSGVRTDQR